jgi:hypothetical protein
MSKYWQMPLFFLTFAVAATLSIYDASGQVMPQSRSDRTVPPSWLCLGSWSEAYCLMKFDCAAKHVSTSLLETSWQSKLDPKVLKSVSLQNPNHLENSGLASWSTSEFLPSTDRLLQTLLQQSQTPPSNSGGKTSAARKAYEVQTGKDLSEPRGPKIKGLQLGVDFHTLDPKLRSRCALIDLLDLNPTPSKPDADFLLEVSSRGKICMIQVPFRSFDAENIPLATFAERFSNAYGVSLKSNAQGTSWTQTDATAGWTVDVRESEVWITAIKKSPGKFD